MQPEQPESVAAGNALPEPHVLAPPAVASVSTGSVDRSPSPGASESAVLAASDRQAAARSQPEAHLTSQRHRAARAKRLRRVLWRRMRSKPPGIEYRRVLFVAFPQDLKRFCDGIAPHSLRHQRMSLSSIEELLHRSGVFTSGRVNRALQRASMGASSRACVGSSWSPIASSTCGRRRKQAASPLRSLTSCACTMHCGSAGTARSRPTLLPAW